MNSQDQIQRTFLPIPDQPHVGLGRARPQISRNWRTLKLNGYSTAQFGKCHEVPVDRKISLK